MASTKVYLNLCFSFIYSRFYRAEAGNKKLVEKSIHHDTEPAGQNDSEFLDFDVVTFMTNPSWI